MNSDGVTLESCQYDYPSETVELTFQGDLLDPTDYIENAYLIIDKSAWRDSCSSQMFPSIVDVSDSMLFLKLREDGFLGLSSCDGVCITLLLSFASGSSVVPTVTISVSEIPGMSRLYGNETNKYQDFSDVKNTELLKLSQGSKLWKDFSISTHTFEFKKTLQIGIISLTVENMFTYAISEFVVKRYWNTAVQWKQTFSASARVELNVEDDVSLSASGTIQKFGIPGYGFSKYIPMVGTVTVGAILSLEWVFDFSASSAFTAEYRVSYSQADLVDVELFPPKYSSRQIFAGPKTNPTGDVVIEREVSANFELVGFIGIRPSLGLEVSIGDKKISGDVGILLGLEISIQGQEPPFQPYMGPNVITIDVCKHCHVVRGQFAVVGKDLDVKFTAPGIGVKAEVLVALVFRFIIGTVCIFPVPERCTPSVSGTSQPELSPDFTESIPPSATVSISSSPSASATRTEFPTASTTFSSTRFPSISTSASPPLSTPPFSTKSMLSSPTVSLSTSLSVTATKTKSPAASTIPPTTLSPSIWTSSEPSFL